MTGLLGVRVGYIDKYSQHTNIEISLRWMGEIIIMYCKTVLVAVFRVGLSTCLK